MLLLFDFIFAEENLKEENRIKKNRNENTGFTI